MKQFAAELLERKTGHGVRPEVEVKKVAIPQGEETYILCRTSGRKEKEKAIRNRFSNSMETALKGLEKAILMGRLKDRNKMERRLGKIQARHPQVNDLYDLALRFTAEGVRLFCKEIKRRSRGNWRESREGAYLLRTNLNETAEELWSKYMQLTEAEASFRALKSKLSIRPLFHQLEPRVRSSRDGGIPRLRAMGHAQTPAEAAACDCSEAIRERSRKRSTDVANESDRSALHLVVSNNWNVRVITQPCHSN